MAIVACKQRMIVALLASLGGGRDRGLAQQCLGFETAKPLLPGGISRAAQQIQRALHVPGHAERAREIDRSAQLD